MERAMKSHNGVVSVRTHHSVDETVARIQAALVEKGIKLFALVDHSGEAQAAGLDMRPTKLEGLSAVLAGVQTLASIM
jgi:uncharacterized protein (DUF302 family)